MPVAYTAPLQPRQGADFSGSIAALGQQRAQKAAQEQAIMKQMEARQKATNKMLSEVDGYDVSKLIPPFRQHFKDMMARKMEEIQGFAIDDPAKARMAVQDIANWFNNHASHNSDEVQASRKMLNEIANDPSAAAKFNEELPVYMQSAATPQGSIMAQQQFEGSGITTQMGPDGTVLYKALNAETGEAEGDWQPIQSWESWANPSTFTAPTKSRYGRSAIQIGETVVRENAKKFNKDSWSRSVATKSATGIVYSGADSKDGAAARAWAVENLFGPGYKDNESLISAYITGDTDNPEYNLHKDYIENTNNELIKEIVDASRFVVEKDEDEDSGKPTFDASSDFDDKSEFTFQASDLMNEGSLLAFDDQGKVMTESDPYYLTEMKGTRYTLGSLAKSTKDTDAIMLNNPNFGQNPALSELNDLKRRYNEITNKNSANAVELDNEIYTLEEKLSDAPQEPEQFNLDLSDMVFMPDGKLALMNLNYKGSKVKTILLDAQQDKAKVDQIIQAIRRVYKDDSITFEKLQKGMVGGPQAAAQNAAQEAAPAPADKLFE